MKQTYLIKMSNVVAEPAHLVDTLAYVRRVSGLGASKHTVVSEASSRLFDPSIV